MALYTVKDGTGAQINYDICESVAPKNVFFIHGNLASNSWWKPFQSEWLKMHGRGYGKGSFLYAEFRGCGKSSAPLNEYHVQMERFADDFISLIKDTGRAPFHLVGHSTGGFIAALMLSKAPHLFERALLLDPVGPHGVKFDPSMIAAFDQMKIDRELVATVIGSTVKGNDGTDSFFRNIIVEDAFRSVKSVGHLVLKALNEANIEKLVSTIPHPVLVCHGQYDQLLPKQDSVLMAQLIPNAKFYEIPNQGHCTNLENPKLFAQILGQEFGF